MRPKMKLGEMKAFNSLSQQFGQYCDTGNLAVEETFFYFKGLP